MYISIPVSNMEEQLIDNVDPPYKCRCPMICGWAMYLVGFIFTPLWIVSTLYFGIWSCLCFRPKMYAYSLVSFVTLVVYICTAIILFIYYRLNNALVFILPETIPFFVSNLNRTSENIIT